MRGISKGTFISKTHLPTTVTNVGYHKESLSNELMLEIQIHKAMDNIHLVPQKCIYNFEPGVSLLYHMIQCHILNKFNPVLWFKQGYNIIFKTISYNFFTNKENSDGN